MFWITIYLSFLYVVARAVEIHGKTVDIGLFHHVSTGDINTGGCDHYKDAISDAYIEAVAMAQRASENLDLVLTPRPDEDKVYDKHHQWNKAARSLEDLFAIKVDANLGIQSKEISDSVINVQDAFKTLVERGINPSPQDATYRKDRFFCGDRFAAPLRKGEMTPDGGKNSFEDNLGWWVPPSVDIVPQIPGLIWERSETTPPCDSSSLKGLTSQTARLVLFCPRTLDGYVTIQEQESTLQIDPNPSKGTPIDTISSFSRTMLHELLHLEFGLKDEPGPEFALENGKLKNDGGNPVLTGKLASGQNSNIFKIYGYVKSYWLARFAEQFPTKFYNLQKQPMHTWDFVDTHVMFAMSMWWTDKQFTQQRGRTQELPHL